MVPEPFIETEIVEASRLGGVEFPDDSGGGGVCCFQGLTRPETHPTLGPLTDLEYEAARPLADRLLRSLAASIARRHALRSLSIRHAVGRVPVGRPSVSIVAIADHRDAAFAACREAIDRTKSEVPIWKRERWRDGSTWSSRATSLSPRSPEIEVSASQRPEVAR
jgi:molybdopterin synthase catalytic subunit